MQIEESEESQQHSSSPEEGRLMSKLLFMHHHMSHRCSCDFSVVCDFSKREIKNKKIKLIIISY